MERLFTCFPFLFMAIFVVKLKTVMYFVLCDLLAYNYKYIAYVLLGLHYFLPFFSFPCNVDFCFCLCHQIAGSLCSIKNEKLNNFRS